jgi:hypothetical protein
MSPTDMPEPSPAGALVPPPRKPPSARAAGTPHPRPRPNEHWQPRAPALRGGVLRLALDFLDNLADVIRAAARR